MNRILSLILIILFTSNALAQNVPFKKRKFRNQKYELEQALIKLQRGDQFYFDKHYDTALELFLECQDLNQKNAILNYKLGDIYLHLHQPKKAIFHLREALKLNKNIDKILYTDLIFDVTPETSIYCKIAYAYALNFEWDQALKYYKIFRASLNRNRELKYTFKGDYIWLFADQRIESCKNGKDYVSNPIEVDIELLNEEVNTIYSEHSPFVTSDGSMLYYTARRNDGMGNENKQSLDAYREDVYKAEYIDGGWYDVGNIGEPINTYTHDATVGISFDAKTLFIYRFSLADGGDIYYSKYQDDMWLEPERFPKTINTEFHESSACFSPDEKVMFFVSDKPGGIGGRDIYYAKRLRNGGWGRAYNLGNEVNTPFDEHSVYMHPDGRTIYFSSKGHSSIGGYDIFKTTLRKGKWSKPENLGYPINTPGDDTYFMLTPDSKIGYYSSHRANGMGSDDIYRVTFPDAKKPGNEVIIIKGRVRRAKKGIKADIDVINNRTHDTVGVYRTNPEDGSYIIPLEKGNNYGLTIQAEGTMFYSENVDLTDESGALNFEAVDQVIKLNSIKVGSRMVLRNIFFQSGEVELLESSMPEFKRLKKFMDKYPKMKIMVIGHTDNVGDPEYNRQLSEMRSKFLVYKLIEFGIAEDRLDWNGYGMEKPIASNDTEEGRKRNRRIEFKILYK